jgi:histidyl-tRNA synthetase
VVGPVDSRLVAFHPDPVSSVEQAAPRRVDARLLKGFRDATPEIEVVRRDFLARLERVAQSFGYLPIETPALEYAEILLAKAGGEAQKQMYRFRDHGDRDVALRFDLTVPFARFMAVHARELPMPFKRYQSGKAWRGENPQKGRYREFVQFDADVVGSDSAVSDFETLLMAAQCAAALELGDFRILVSHRGIITQLLAQTGASAHLAPIMRVIDKAGSLSENELQVALSEHADAESLAAVLALLDAGRGGGTAAAVLARIRSVVGEGDGVARLQQLAELAADHEPLASALTIDPSIMRGLDYYTGVVFETALVQLPQVGSIGAGGRYDDLVGLYSSERLPGVGMSVGLDRIVHALADEGRLPQPGLGADLLVFCMSEALASDYQRLANQFRAAGVRTDVYPDARKLKAQFAYAERVRIPLGLFYGEDEQATGRLQIKELVGRKEHANLTPAEALSLTQRLLATT